MKIISREQAVKLINDQKESGVFFNCLFIKRSTGELRTMTCRGGVQKYVKGIGMAYDPSSKGLIGVWEAGNSEGAKGSDAYRMISVEGIREIHAGGVKYKVKD